MNTESIYIEIIALPLLQVFLIFLQHPDCLGSLLSRERRVHRENLVHLFHRFFPRFRCLLYNPEDLSHLEGHFCLVDHECLVRRRHLLDLVTQLNLECLMDPKYTSCLN